MLRLLVGSALLLAAQVAFAQSGTCQGQMRGFARLALAQPDGSFRGLASSETTTFFGRAECECGTTDVSLEIDLSDALPTSIGGVAVAEIWVGDSSCMDPTVRTSASNTTCEKIATPSVQDFTINSTAGATGVHYAIPARTLFSPFKHDCASAPQFSTNGIYVFVYTDVNDPLATCSLPLVESQQQPDPATDLTATWQDDGSVVVRWTPAPLGAGNRFYDVLCATDVPAATGTFNTVDFSQCTADGIVRRSLLDDNGGFIPSGSLETAGADPFSPPSPRAVCAHVSAGETSATLRLAEASHYRFAVVAADAYGNFTISPTITLDAPPRAPAKQGGCSLGGRASVTPSALILAVAAFVFAVARRRAR